VLDGFSKFFVLRLKFLRASHKPLKNPQLIFTCNRCLGSDSAYRLHVELRSAL
jgi:hypothetical protein